MPHGEASVTMDRGATGEGWWEKSRLKVPAVHVRNASNLLRVGEIEVVLTHSGGLGALPGVGVE